MRRFVLCLTLCYFVLVFSVLLALRLPRLGKSELILRFVIVALPGLFSYLCFIWFYKYSTVF